MSHQVLRLAVNSPRKERIVENRVCSYGIVERGLLSIITVSGSVGADTVPGLKSLLMSNIRRRQHIILCMADVSRIDFAGLTLLVDASAAARSCQVELALVDISECVHRLLESNLHTGTFQIHNSLPSAKLQVVRRLEIIHQ